MALNFTDSSKDITGKPKLFTPAPEEDLKESKKVSIEDVLKSFEKEKGIIGYSTSEDIQRKATETQRDRIVKKRRSSSRGGIENISEKFREEKNISPTTEIKEEPKQKIRISLSPSQKTDRTGDLGTSSGLFKKPLVSEDSSMSITRERLNVATLPEEQAGRKSFLQSLDKPTFEEFAVGGLTLSQPKTFEQPKSTIVEKEGGLFEKQPYKEETFVLERKLSPEEKEKQEDKLKEFGFESPKEANLFYEQEANQLFNRLSDSSNKIQNLNDRYKEFDAKGEKADYYSRKSQNFQSKFNELNNEQKLLDEEIKNYNLYDRDNLEKARDLQAKQFTLDNKKENILEEYKTFEPEFNTFVSQSQEFANEYKKLKDEQSEIITRGEKNPLFVQENGSFSIQKFKDNDIVASGKVTIGGEETPISSNPFVKGFQETFSGQTISPKETDALSTIARYTGAGVGAFGGSFFAREKSLQSSKETLQKIGLSESSSDFGSKLAGYTSLAAPGSLGLKVVGGTAKFASKIPVIGKYVGGIGKIAKTGSQALPSITLAGTGAAGTVYGIGKGITGEVDIKDLQQNYGVSVVEGKRIANEIGSDFIPIISGAIPQASFLAESKRKEFDTKIDDYLESKGITKLEDKNRYKQAVIQEFGLSSGAETVGMVAGISAGTERLGQKYIAPTFAKESLEGSATNIASKISLEKGADVLAGKTGQKIAGLGIAEGLSSEMLQSATRGQDVTGTQLALSGTLGGVSAGVFGKEIVRSNLYKDLGLKQNKFREFLGKSAYVLDPYEKPGDIIAKLKKPKVEPGIIPKYPTPYKQVPKGVKPIGFTPTGITTSLTIPTTTLSTTPSMTTEQQITSKISEFTKTPSTSFITTPTSTTTPSSVTTPTTTSSTIPSLTTVGTTTPTTLTTTTTTPTTTATTTPTSVTIPTPQNFGIFPVGWGSAFLRGQKNYSAIGLKKNPIKSLKELGFIKKI